MLDHEIFFHNQALAASATGARPHWNPEVSIQIRTGILDEIGFKIESVVESSPKPSTGKTVENTPRAVVAPTDGSRKGVASATSADPAQLPASSSVAKSLAQALQALQTADGMLSGLIDPAFMTDWVTTDIFDRIVVDGEQATLPNSSEKPPASSREVEEDDFSWADAFDYSIKEPVTVSLTPPKLNSTWKAAKPVVHWHDSVQLGPDSQEKGHDSDLEVHRSKRARRKDKYEPETETSKDAQPPRAKRSRSGEKKRSADDSESAETSLAANALSSMEPNAEKTSTTTSSRGSKRSRRSTNDRENADGGSHDAAAPLDTPLPTSAHMTPSRPIEAESRSAEGVSQFSSAANQSKDHRRKSKRGKALAMGPSNSTTQGSEVASLSTSRAQTLSTLRSSAAKSQGILAGSASAPDDLSARPDDNAFEVDASTSSEAKKPKNRKHREKAIEGTEVADAANIVTRNGDVSSSAPISEHAPTDKEKKHEKHKKPRDKDIRSVDHDLTVTTAPEQAPTSLRLQGQAATEVGTLVSPLGKLSHKASRRSKRHKRHPVSILATPLLWACIIAIVMSPVAAITRALADVVDWHKPLIGTPRSDLPPIIDRRGAGSTDDRLVTVTQRSVLASIGLSDGEIRWRHINDDTDAITALHVAGDDQIFTASGIERTVLRAFSATTGHLLWESLATAEPIQMFEASPVANNLLADPKRLYAVIGGSKIVVVDRQTGETAWSYEEVTEGLLWSRPVSHVSGVKVVGLARGFDGFNIAILEIDPDGKAAEEPRIIPSKVNAISDLALISSSHLAWVDQGRTEIRGLRLNEMSAQPRTIAKGYQAIQALDHLDRPWIIGKRDDGTGDVVDLSGHAGIVKYSFASHSEPSELSTFYGFFANSQGDEGIARAVVSSASQIQFDLRPNELSKDHLRTVFTTTSGVIKSLSEHGSNWVRDEGLADIVAAVMVELPEKKGQDVVRVLEDESFLGTVQRHIGDATGLPTYLFRFLRRFLSGSYREALSSIPLQEGRIFRDQFGFQKLAVLASSNGKIYAIDSAHGNSVWTLPLELKSDYESQAQITGLWNVRGVSETANPIIAVVAVSGGSTFGVHIDAFTGQIVKADELFLGTPRASFPLPASHCKTKIQAMGVVDRDNRTHVFPFCKKIRSGIQNQTTGIVFAIIANESVVGRRLTVATDKAFASEEIWRLSNSERSLAVVDYVKPQSTASYGRILGDRSVLYKYLNPHVLALSWFDARRERLDVDLIDTTDGTIVHSISFDRASDAAVSISMVDNWLTVAFREPGALGKQRLASVELFEGNSTAVESISRVFISPVQINTLTTSNSRYGITNKDLVYITERGEIAHIPRRLLDPRRPNVPSKIDREEGLIPFDVLLPGDPRGILTNIKNVRGTRQILFSPALLESTSTFVSYGLDLFGSRITPSGTFDILSDAFNKSQLLLTLSGLIFGIAIAAPAVHRRTLKQRWY